jgi:hypothetical protein
MTEQARRRAWWLLPVVSVLLPLVIVGLVLWLVATVVLLVIVWLTWCTRGRYALVVYSNSPVWQEYFETRVVPDLAGRAMVLNWSERKGWQNSLPVLLFRVFAGTREFNPIAIVFEPLAWPRRFRFYRAFQSLKHGRRDEVDQVRAEFLQLLTKLATPTAASATNGNGA